LGSSLLKFALEVMQKILQTIMVIIWDRPSMSQWPVAKLRLSSQRL